MLKELVIAFQSYFKAHRFISKHRLWKWIIIPGIIYALLFFFGMWLFLSSSTEAIAYLSSKLGIVQWLKQSDNAFLNFLFIFGRIIFQLIVLFFYFSLFKYIFLIVGSPVFAYLSEKTESILEGKDYPFNFQQLLKDIVRGIKLALRNTLWQTVYTLAILILSMIPVVGWITPVIAFLVECYYYGFSMLDYSCERHKLTPSQSIAFIGRHKGLAIGNGIIFFLMHGFLLVGWVLAPAYAVVAATISLYHQKDDV
ncbi:MAG: EI24 domain-containing protein [Sphingobacteriales bacterium]|nr:EI24 domain-containing protein [Sphingobacteriales bacterium]